MGQADARRRHFCRPDRKDVRRRAPEGGLHGRRPLRTFHASLPPSGRCAAFAFLNAMQNLVEDFLQFLRHERGQSDNTAKTYAALLGKFTAWAAKQNLADWKSVELKHLMAFLQHERERNLLPAGRGRWPSAKTSRAGRDTANEDGGSSGASRHQDSLRRLS